MIRIAFKYSERHSAPVAHEVVGGQKVLGVRTYRGTREIIRQFETAKEASAFCEQERETDPFLMETEMLGEFT